MNNKSLFWMLFYIEECFIFQFNVVFVGCIQVIIISKVGIFIKVDCRVIWQNYFFDFVSRGLYCCLFCWVGVIVEYEVYSYCSNGKDCYCCYFMQLI